MGCLYSPLPKEMQYHGVDYSNVETIQGLLRFYNSMKANAVKTMNMEALSIYFDVEEAINNIELTDKQRQVLYLYIAGYTEIEMGKIMNTSHQASHKLIIKVCNKIIKYLMGE